MLTYSGAFVAIVTIIVRAVRALARSRADLILENLALRQQVTALKRERPRPTSLVARTKRGTSVCSKTEIGDSRWRQKAS